MPKEAKKLEEKPKQPSKISRREFLKDAGLIVGGATVGGVGILSACSGDKTLTNTTTKNITTTVTGPAGTKTVTITAPSSGGATVTVTAPPPTQVVDEAESQKTIRLTINGFQYEKMVASNQALQNFLHDDLQFNSVKNMCGGYGACGSCTIIMDGKAILACMTLAVECDGKDIETAEGIAAANHPLVEAYVQNHCMQCGYCTPGFLCSTKALMDKKPNPTEADVYHAIAGNVCRCATYQAHPLAVLQAAGQLKGGK